MGAPRICIYYANTGGGHKSAANAVAGGIRAALARGLVQGPKVTIRQRSIAENTHPVNFFLVTLYNYMARYHTTWIKYFYKFVHFMQPDSEVFYRFYRPYLHALLKADKPSMVVVCHPMLPQCLAYALQELGLKPKVKLAVVITDPNENLWRGWGAEKADLIIAPNNVVRDCLLSWGIAPDKIKVLGMPIHPKFLAPSALPRTRFLKKLGLDPATFTVCLNSSWAGNEHWLDIYRNLAKSSRKLQVIFLCGHNEKLQDSVRAVAAETNIPTAILKFHNKMPELMSAVDLMVTKAGGLTTYEAVARRLPLVLDNTIEPMPQEAPTMRMMVETGLAEELHRPEDIVSVIENAQFPVHRQEQLPHEYQLDLTDHAIFDMARNLLPLLHQEEAPLPLKAVVSTTDSALECAETAAAIKEAA